MAAPRLAMTMTIAVAADSSPLTFSIVAVGRDGEKIRLQVDSKM